MTQPVESGDFNERYYRLASEIESALAAADRNSARATLNHLTGIMRMAEKGGLDPFSADMHPEMIAQLRFWAISGQDDPWGWCRWYLWGLCSNIPSVFSSLFHDDLDVRSTVLADKRLSESCLQLADDLEISYQRSLQD